MEQLINYIEEFVKLDDDAKAALHELTEMEHFSKNKYILEPGQRCNKIWFLKRGMVRKFYLNDGQEETVWIHTENQTFTSLESYAQNTPSKEYLQACEDSELICITKGNSEKLAEFPKIVAFVNAMMGREFANIDKHTKALNQRDAKGKYEYLREIAPELLKRAKLGHIASIIGVSRETVSRIRKA
ncbi:Crp/Fnr family transcriptional regulator [Sunxiuqinia indica]|uniref:Crp/Fnr family transcriptional regulator n=1 Tax=Sunxiuqinia indica TaxID=2692584 RepID=UPI001356D7CD|nr:Crp/Fnr family transcriptional regulator [Sunxiuqinia indica]